MDFSPSLSPFSFSVPLFKAHFVLNVYFVVLYVFIIEFNVVICQEKSFHSELYVVLCCQGGINMEPINSRFKMIRKELKLSQEGLGNSLGLSKSGISNIENGMRNVTETHIRLLCSELNINEEWLRTGRGKMFVETDESILAEFTKEYKLDDLDRSIIEGYMNLSPEQRAVIKSYVMGVADKYAELDKKEKKSTSKVVTFAAHKDDDSDWTEEEEKEIDAFSKLADELNGDE
jgi:transcriptional regulator with XRE-family HTH domain